MSFDSRHPEGYLLALQKKKVSFCIFLSQRKKGGIASAAAQGCKNLKIWARAKGYGARGIFVKNECEKSLNFVMNNVGRNAMVKATDDLFWCSKNKSKSAV
jgi:hypothetical protein